MSLQRQTWSACGMHMPVTQPRPGHSLETAACIKCLTRALDTRSWGLFRDRRPDLYGPLLTLDGKTTVKCTIPTLTNGH